MTTNHIFEKPSLVVETAVRILQRMRVLPALVTTDSLGDFGGSSDDTINIRVPALANARERVMRDSDRTIISDDLVEYTIPVKLTDHIYSAIKLQDEQRTLDIRDFARQVLQPQVSAVAYKLEDKLAALIDSAGYEEVLKLDPSDPFPGFVDGRKALNDENVADDSRVLLVGSAVEAQILKSEQFRHADKAGDNNALRRAYLGDMAGMRAFRSNAVAEDAAYIWHPTAFVYVNRAPVAAEGVVASASFGADGVALRWLADYSWNEIGNRSLVDVFAGYKVIKERDGRFVRGVKLRLGITGIDAGGDFGVGAGQGRQLRVKDSNGMNITEDAVFTSSDPGTVNVDADGFVVGAGAGTATVTVAYPDPNGGADHVDEVEVTVS